jgi:hypothetical protein
LAENILLFPFDWIDSLSTVAWRQRPDKKKARPPSLNLYQLNFSNLLVD